MSQQVPPFIVDRLVLGAVVVVLVAGQILNARNRTRVAGKLLAPWAQANGYQFISLKKKWFRLGPFRWRTVNAVVFRGVVLTTAGERRAGYFRVGGRLLGLLIDRVDVEWDK